jgi:hypothetical protein
LSLTKTRADAKSYLDAGAAGAVLRFALSNWASGRTLVGLAPVEK